MVHASRFASEKIAGFHSAGEEESLASGIADTSNRFALIEGRRGGKIVARDGDGIYTHKDRPGYWISYKDAAGRRRRRKVEAPNRTEARNLRSDHVSREETAKAHGIRPAGLETFANGAQDYLAHQKPRISTANYRRECSIIEDHLKPFFGGELKAIRRATVQRYITARCAEVSNATVAKELNVLKHLLRLAVEE